MKKYITYAMVGLAGYFIGFYEMKYKVVKLIAEGQIKDKEKTENILQEEEAL